jgi:hypothetical protein
MAKTKTFIILAVALACACACSIKEDRNPCPCWLSIDFRWCADDMVTVSAWGRDEIFSERVATEDYQSPNYYERTVPKGYVSTSVVRGERDMVRNGARLIIPYGHDADSIYAHAGIVGCFEEFATDTVFLHKQFARVFMSMDVPQGHDYPYTFKVCSDVCGIDLRDLSPVEGLFEIDLRLDKDNICVFCLPRQKTRGGALSLPIYQGDELIETIPLAEWINCMGYDWQKKDLEDIYIGVDYAKAQVSILIKGWEEGYSFKVEI